ncbi:MAG: hypothetical protein H7831_11565 [Magnetococcus sp. WYHC-3]
MSWQDHLLSEEQQTVVLPWVGQKNIYGQGQRWEIKGSFPEEHGWHRFKISGNRKARYVEPTTAPDRWELGHASKYGYLVGERFIPDVSYVIPEPELILEQTNLVHLVEAGLERFTRVKIVDYEQRFYVFYQQEFPLGPESEVLSAFLDRQESIAHIKFVTPALDLAFRFESFMRLQIEERRRQTEERRRLEQEQEAREALLRQQMTLQGSSAGRRALAQVDFQAAAQAALQLSGAALLDTRPSYRRNEMVVQFRFSHRRFECVVDRNTLQIIDAGICLRGNDATFTLESLPLVIDQAIKESKLHVFRHVDGDRDNTDDHFDDMDDDD